MSETKYDRIIRELGKIEQHLRELNGNVGKNVRKIDNLEKRQMEDDLDRAKIEGGWKVLAIVGSVALVVGGWIVKFMISK